MQGEKRRFGRSAPRGPRREFIDSEDVAPPTARAAVAQETFAEYHEAIVSDNRRQRRARRAGAGANREPYGVPEDAAAAGDGPGGSGPGGSSQAIEIDIGELCRQEIANQAAYARERNQDTSMARTALGAAIDVNKETMTSLNKAEAMASGAEQIGNNITGALRMQREVIERVDSTLDEMPSQLKRAKKEMITILRRMFRDKVFLTIFCAVLGLGVAAIAVMIKRRVDNATSGPAPAPPTTIIVPPPVITPSTPPT